MAAPGPTISVGVVRGFPGATVELPVTIRFPSNTVPTVVAMQADVGYDGRRARVESGPGALAAGRRFLTSEPISGLQRMLWYGPELRVFSNGVLALLRVSVATNAGFSPIQLNLRNVVLATAEPVSVVSSNRTGAVAISTVYVRPDGDVDAFIAVTNGVTYRIQATTNFVEWETISEQTAESSLMQFIDLDAHSYPYRFYRALPVELQGAAGAPEGQGAGNVVQGWALAGVDGLSYVVEASTNLVQWRAITTNVAVGGRVEFSDPDARQHRVRFYRTRRP
jgi:hypothetical protein